MRKHDCGCQTAWDDEANHPIYLSACSLHRRLVPDGWWLTKRARKLVDA
jgi:hypothetical protein